MLGEPALLYNMAREIKLGSALPSNEKSLKFAIECLTWISVRSVKAKSTVHDLILSRGMYMVME